MTDVVAEFVESLALTPLLLAPIKAVAVLDCVSSV